MSDSASSATHSRPTILLVAAALVVPAFVLTPFVGTAAAYTVHAPISLGSPAAIASEAAAEHWPGAGTQASPYVISGYEFTTGGTYGAAIYLDGYGGNVWVDIKNNWIHGAPGGIALRFALSGHISGNVIENLGTGGEGGINSGWDNNLTVSGNTIHANPTTNSGIDLADYGPNVISGNTVTGAAFGILAWSNQQTVTGNTVSGSSTFGIWSFGYGSPNIVADNRVDSVGRDCIASIEYSPSILRNVVSHCAQDGIRVYASYGAGIPVVGENTVTTSPIGVRVDSVMDYVVRGNIVRDAGDFGIIAAGRGATIAANDVENRTTGIYVVGGRDHLVAANVVKGGSDGIYLLGSNLDTITGNRVTANARGLTLNASQGNVVYDNVFANAKNALVINSDDNEWSVAKTPGTNAVGGPFLGGNFWSDYTGVDVDHDGLGDVTYGLVPAGEIPSLPPQAPTWIPAPAAPTLPVTPPAPPTLPSPPPGPHLPVTPPAPPQPATVYSQFLAYGPYDKHPLMTLPVAVATEEVTSLVPAP
ncbi:MAG: right-handed parallel beta-helix repeat-containing protein [Thermoplasmatota archaeon]